MPRYKVTIAESATYELVVDADTPEDAAGLALEVFGGSETPEVYLTEVNDREVYRVVPTDDAPSPAAIPVFEALRQLGPDVDLDELVNETKDVEAAVVNNGGREAQMAYLLKAGVSIDEMRELAADLA